MIETNIWLYCVLCNMIKSCTDIDIEAWNVILLEIKFYLFQN